MANRNDITWEQAPIEQLVGTLDLALGLVGGRAALLKHAPGVNASLGELGVVCHA